MHKKNKVARHAEHLLSHVHSCSISSIALVYGREANLQLTKEVNCLLTHSHIAFDPFCLLWLRCNSNIIKGIVWPDNLGCNHTGKLTAHSNMSVGRLINKWNPGKQSSHTLFSSFLLTYSCESVLTRFLNKSAWLHYRMNAGINHCCADIRKKKTKKKKD